MTLEHWLTIHLKKVNGNNKVATSLPTTHGPTGKKKMLISKLLKPP